MRILVTGGAGFIGARLVNELLDAGHSVVILDDLRLGVAPPTGSGQLHTCVATLGSLEAAHAIRSFAPQCVFHLAAIHYVPYAEAHPGETRAVNVAATAWLLDVLGRTPCHTIVACSSAAVYGFGIGPLDEHAPIAAQGAYGRSKAQMEQVLQQQALARPDQTIVAARLFNVYGPGDQHPHLIPSMLQQICAGKTVHIGNVWPTRDYVYVDDVAAALMRLASVRPGLATYNVGTGVGTSVIEIVRHLAALIGRAPSIEIDPTRVRFDDGHLVADAGKLAETFSWAPRVDLLEGLTRLVDQQLALAG